MSCDSRYSALLWLRLFWFLSRCYILRLHCYAKILREQCEKISCNFVNLIMLFRGMKNCRSHNNLNLIFLDEIEFLLVWHTFIIVNEFCDSFFIIYYLNKFSNLKQCFYMQKFQSRSSSQQQRLHRFSYNIVRLNRRLYIQDCTLYQIRQSVAEYQLAICKCAISA